MSKKCGWSMTTDFVTALNGGYIGEIVVAPKKITDSVHFALFRRHFPTITLFYYGKRDARLSELFGYST